MTDLTTEKPSSEETKTSEESVSSALGRVCVIGAGPSGLSVLHAFSEAARKGCAIPEIVCYERQSDWGGQWLFSPYSGLNHYGEPVHSAMYFGLWGNACKEGLELSDYSFEEHYGRTIPSYPPRAVIAQYLTGRAKKSGFRAKIRFDTSVRMVSKTSDGSQFRVMVEDLKNDETEEQLFDYVIVAVGHFWSPHLPRIPGIASFPGRVIHAREYRRADQFAGMRVCVVGSSYSAEDIAVQILHSGGKSVIMSWRSEKSGIVHPPSGFSQKPEITNVSGSEVTFQDGSTAELDAIIYCTGYEYKFPFLPKSLKIPDKKKCFYVHGLFKGTVFTKDTHLFYIGMQDQWYTFTMFDAEAWFIREIILGRVSLPSDEVMAADMKSWRMRLEGIRTSLEDLDFQRDYILDLMSQVSDEHSLKYNAEAAAQEMRVFRKEKYKGITTFRDTQHTSAVTGNKQGRLAKKWLDIWKEDSLEAYMKLIV